MENPKRLPYRLSISLNKEQLDFIAQLESKYGISKSKILRNAVCYLKAVEEAGGASPEQVKESINYMKENFIANTAIIQLLFTEIGDGSNKFWKNVQEIGRNYWKSCSEKGITEIKECLEYFEHANWYKLEINSDKVFTIIPFDRIAKRFLINFAKGFFEMAPYKVNITKIYGRLQISVD